VGVVISVGSLLAARVPGDEASLRALAAVLAARVVDTPVPAADPVEQWGAVEDRGGEVSGTWQEVRAARDHGDLSSAEYEFLAATVDVMTQEAE
jgi:hypothetical protein